MNRKYGPLLTLVLILSIALVGCAGSEESGTSQNESEGETREFKIAISGGELHPHFHSIQAFKEELEERSDGRFEVEIYPEGVLGLDSEIMSQLNEGSVQMAMIIVGELANQSSSFNAWSIPSLIGDRYAAYEMGNTEEALALFDTLGEESGVHPLGYMFIEMRDVLSTDSITEANDLEGTNIRVTPTPVIVDFWERLGANPTSVEISEVYTSFQQGVIDAVDTGPIGISQSRTYEIGKHLLKMNHTAFTGAGLVSQQFWEGLSEEDRVIIEESFEIARERNIEFSEELEAESMETMNEAGVTITEFEETEEFLQTVEEFHDDYADEDEYISDFIDKANEISSE